MYTGHNHLPCKLQEHALSAAKYAHAHRSPESSPFWYPRTQYRYRCGHLPYLLSASLSLARYSICVPAVLKRHIAVSCRRHCMCTGYNRPSCKWPESPWQQTYAHPLQGLSPSSSRRSPCKYRCGHQHECSPVSWSRRRNPRYGPAASGCPRPRARCSARRCDSGIRWSCTSAPARRPTRPSRGRGRG